MIERFGMMLKQMKVEDEMNRDSGATVTVIIINNRNSRGRFR